MNCRNNERFKGKGSLEVVFVELLLFRVICRKRVGDFVCWIEEIY